MARLNDLPPVAESLDSLKRRFVRQNREIARANSVQSTRIRTLESEVSSLVAENVTLREKISQLNRELEKHQGSERFDNQLSIIKEKLEAKLVELSGLVSDLGSLPQKRGHSLATKQTLESSGLLRSPIPCHRPAKASQSTPIAEEDRLPVILEDKQYPRSTPEIEEVPESPINDGNISSVSILPPVFPFAPDGLGPLSIEKSPKNTACSRSKHSVSPDQSPALEMRRRRRDSSFLQDIISDAEPVAGHDDYDIKPEPSRAGSKRKYAMREEEELNSALLNGQDDFQYTRLDLSCPDLPQEPDIGTEGQASRVPCKPDQQLKEDRKSGRRALGPKSSNTNLRSPRKRSAEKVKGVVEEKRPSTRTKGKPRNKTNTEECGRVDNQKSSFVEFTLSRPTSNALPVGASSQLFKEEDTALNTLPPIAAPRHIDDVPSAQTPAALDPDSEDMSASTNVRTRQSRRSRGPVSYVEPNLRHKMRRPTEELVDAVGEDRFRRVSRAQPEHTPKPVKAEPMDNRCTQQERDRTLGLSNTANERRTKTDSTLFGSPSQERAAGQSTSSIAISTLVAGSKKRCQSNRQSDSWRHPSNLQVSGGSVPLSIFPAGRQRGLTPIDFAGETERPAEKSFGGPTTEDSAPPLLNQNEYSQNTTSHAEIGDSQSSVGMTRTQRGPSTRRRSMMI
ncbi:hypothetical protein PRK78_001060 [Emydomyces testavorans]|uniref:Shugoshin n=1 Tax=Emydomyces testavorans TaxID=2070801 RepID=A0AAF0DBW2_9EURO|nr:hypothetical protein PRK78_001060 [Emydomyces testavorans]